jgi:hypothetical protein
MIKVVHSIEKSIVAKYLIVRAALNGSMYPQLKRSYDCSSNYLLYDVYALRLHP